LIGLSEVLFHLVRDLAAVTVDAVSNAVDEQIVFAVDRDRRQISYVIVKRDDIALIYADVSHEVVAVSRRVVINIMFFDVLGVVYETVDRPVTAADDELVVRLLALEKARVIEYRRNVDRLRFFVFQLFEKGRDRLLTRLVV
jgi:hypothetical protein